MYKKIISIGMAFLLSLGMVGCQKEQVNNQDEIVTISFSWWGNDERQERTLKAVKAFEEKYPNIKVKVKFGEWTGFQKKMSIYVLGHNEPDVMQVNYAWLEEYSSQGDGFYDLDKVKEQIDQSQFDEAILNYGRSNGILNGIPISLNGKVLFYNQNLFNEVGAKVPESWDELIAVGEQFEAKGKYVLAMNEVNAFTLCKAYVEQKTGHNFLTQEKEIGFDQADFKEMYRFYKQLVAKHIISPDFSVDHVKKGEAAGTLDWYSKTSKVEENIQKANGEMVLGKLPILENAKDTGWDVKPTMLFAMGKNTKHPEEAAKLLNFLLCEEEGIEALQTERGLPIAKSAEQYLEAQNEIDEKQKVSKQYLDAASPELMSCYFENTALTSIYEEIMQQMLYSEVSEEEWSKEAYNSLVGKLALVK